VRVLVTGAAGYTGTRLVERLRADGHSVRALVRRQAQAAPLRALGARVVVGDVANRTSLAGIAANIDVAYHLVGTLAGGNARMRRVLVDGTRHLLEACRTAGAGAGGPLRALIVTSNAVVYGDGGGNLLDEGSPCRPAFPLGRLNQSAEEELRCAAASGVPITVLRVGAIYGPGRLSSDLVRSGRFRIIGSGRNYSSRIHVEDLLSVLLALGEVPRPGAIYCVGDEEPCAVNDYYALLADHLGVAPPVHIPAWLARGRGRARATLARLRGRAPFVDANVIGLFTADVRLDSELLRGQLDLRLRYPSFRVGLPAALAAEGISLPALTNDLQSRQRSASE
jgi:nucleoside-diphosphate-sugar epimerase